MSGGSSGPHMYQTMNSQGKWLISHKQNIDLTDGRFNKALYGKHENGVVKSSKYGDVVKLGYKPNATGTGYVKAKGNANRVLRHARGLNKFANIAIAVTALGGIVWAGKKLFGSNNKDKQQ